MLDARRLRLLVELSRRGTIAASAEALGYSPSAVSQQLTVLEREAGSTLIEPVGRKVRLTADGELLVQHARIVLRAIETAESELASSRTVPVGTVRLAAFQSAMLSFVPDAVARLVDEYPTLRVDLTELEPEQSLPALQAGDFDVVIAEAYPGAPNGPVADLDMNPLLDDELTLVVPEGWSMRTMADLADRPFAMEPRGTAPRNWCESVCGAAGFEPDARVESSDLQVHLRMVDAGLAAALLPGLAGARQHPGVRVIDLAGRPVRRVSMATRSGSRQRPAIAELLRALTSGVENGPVSRS